MSNGNGDTAAPTGPSNALRLGDFLTQDSEAPLPAIITGLMIILDNDGSRRALGTRYFTPSTLYRVKDYYLPRNQILMYWGEVGVTDSFVGPIRYGKETLFMPYPDASGEPLLAQVEPVNPVPYLHGYHKLVNSKKVWIKGWFEHTSTFAHEIDQLYADHTHQMRQPDSYKTLPDMPHDTESNMRNQNALQVGRGMCGYAFQQTEDFARLPIDGGGTGNVATDWKLHYPKVLEDIQELCVFCEHAFFLRQFLIKHDMLAWRNALDEVLVKRAGDQELRYMRCPKVDKTSEPWMPSTENFATFSGNAPLRWWKNNMVKWGEAVDYYDAHYGQRPSE